MNYKKASILLQIIVLTACFLPFYPTSCEKHETETAIEHDSTFVIDSIGKLIDSSGIINEDTTVNKDTIAATKHDSTLTEQLSSKNQFLKLILRPNDNYSLAGFITDHLYELFDAIGAIIILLLLLSTIHKIFNSVKFSISINIITLVILFMYNPMMVFGKKLWGSTVMITLLLFTILFDIYSEYKKTKQ